MISVVMAYYRGELYIDEQIQSILSQLDRQDELIISVDDEEGIPEALERWAKIDMRIHLVKGPSLGVVANFVHAMEQAKGDILVLSDQDDVWMENKLESLRKAFANPRVVAVLHNAKIVDENLEPLGEDTFSWRNSGPGFWKNLWKNSYIGCCMAFRRKIISKVLPIPEKVFMHDQWIGLLAQQLGQVQFMEEPLMLYRRHENNVTELSHGSMWSMMDKRYHMMIEVNRRVREWKKQHG